MLGKIRYFFRRPLQIPIVLITKLPYFRFIHETSDYQGHVNFAFWFKQKILNLGGNSKAYWPVHWTSQVYDVENIMVGVDAYPGIMKGCYITGRGGLSIGDYTQIAPNVIIVTANHDLYDSRKHICASVKIGKYCWIGAGAKIMPGVELGDWTIVGAGAVVTQSFAEGHCLVGGVPAKKIKELEKEKCIPFEVKVRYHGYIRADKFEKYRKKLAVSYGEDN
ncbi:acyltransferase [Pseudoflavitalea sp. X16]|uniref:acyltransferase n=1 Tax=Paraflavitalea devenefica TaxID=2716334 RepID=UPI00141D8C28|nr:acyltransferase [Paraflavitalea devenefica]NII24093.1 acyltransferase [Paraflavitalea devenefica]